MIKKLKVLGLKRGFLIFNGLQYAMWSKILDIYDIYDRFKFLYDFI